jgi:rubrerythrin
LQVQEFDLDKYLRASKRLDLSGLAWDRIKDHDVSTAEARVLTYMMDIESHTVIFLRDLLATRAAREGDITAFLACWVFEELWHGEAFSRFLGEAGFRFPPDGEVAWRDSPYPTKRNRQAWIRRKMGSKGYFAHIGTLIGSALTGDDFPAVHMMWGAVNEFSTLTAYQQLIARTKHPVLIDLLGRVIKDERRHYAFYRSQAELRLRRSSRARRLTRWAMERLWAPVGTGVRPQEETDFLIFYLWGDDQGLSSAREMDRKFSSVPGFSDSHLYENARREVLARVGTKFDSFKVSSSQDASIPRELRPGPGNGLRGAVRAADRPADS